MGEDRLKRGHQWPTRGGARNYCEHADDDPRLPAIGFVGGLVSQLFLPFAITVTFALAASLICALDVVPVLAYLFIDKVKLNVDADGEPKNSFWIRVYTPSITAALRNRWTRYAVVVVAFVLFILSGTLVGQLPTQFINTGQRRSWASRSRRRPAPIRRPCSAWQPRLRPSCWPSRRSRLSKRACRAVRDTSFTTILSALNGQPANSATMTHPARRVGGS